MADLLKKNGEERYGKIVPIGSGKYVIAELSAEPTPENPNPPMKLTARLLNRKSRQFGSFDSLSQAASNLPSGWSVFTIATPLPICTGIAISLVSAIARNQVQFSYVGDNLTDAAWEIRNGAGQIVESGTLTLTAPTTITLNLTTQLVDAMYSLVFTGVSCTGTVSAAFEVDFDPVTTLPQCTGLNIVSVETTSRTQLRIVFEGQNVSEASWELKNSSNVLIDSGSRLIGTFDYLQSLNVSLDDGEYAFILTGISCIGTISKTFFVNLDVSLPVPVFSSTLADTDDVITITTGQATPADIEIYDGEVLLTTLPNISSSTTYVFSTIGTFKARLKVGTDYSAFSSNIVVNEVSTIVSQFYAQPHTDGQREYFGYQPNDYNLGVQHSFSGNMLTITPKNANDRYYFDLIRPGKDFSGTQSFDMSEFAGYKLTLIVIFDKQIQNDGLGDFFRPTISGNLYGYWVSTIYIPRTSNSDIPAWMDTSDEPETYKYLFDEKAPTFTPPLGVNVMLEATKEIGDTGQVQLPNFTRGITHGRPPYVTDPTKMYVFSYDGWLSALGLGGLGNPYPNIAWIVATANAVQLMKDSWDNENPLNADIAFLDGESFTLDSIFSSSNSADAVSKLSQVFSHMRTRHNYLSWWTYNPYVPNLQLKTGSTTLAQYKSHYNYTTLTDLINSGNSGTLWASSGMYNDFGQHFNLWCVGRYLNMSWDYSTYWYLQQLEVLNNVKTVEALVGFFWSVTELLAEPDSAPLHLQYDHAIRNGNQISYWERVKPNAPPAYDYSSAFWSVWNRVWVFNWFNNRHMTNDKQYNYQETAILTPVGNNPFLNINPKEVGNPPEFFYRDPNSQKLFDWAMLAVYDLSQPIPKSIIESNAPSLFTDFTYKGVRYSGDYLYPAYAAANKLPLVRSMKHPERNEWIIGAENHAAGGIEVETITVHLPNSSINVDIKLKGQFSKLKVFVH